MIVIDGVELGRCVTVKAVAERLGVSEKTAWKMLSRLARRGVLEKKKVLGRAVVYCVREGELRLSASRRRRLGGKVRRRVRSGWVDVALELVGREGCIATSALCSALNVGEPHVRYALKRLLDEGRIAKVYVGKTAIWCRDRAAAEELIRRLRDAVRRLVALNNFRYVTPSKALQAVRADKKMYAFFSRFIPLSRLDGDGFSPTALAFMSHILRSLYGEPLKYSNNKPVYIASPPLRQP